MAYGSESDNPTGDTSGTSSPVAPPPGGWRGPAPMPGVLPTGPTLAGDGNFYLYDPASQQWTQTGLPGGVDPTKPIPGTEPPTPPPTSGPGPTVTAPSGPLQPTPDIFNAPLTAPYGQTFTAPPAINQGGPAGLPIPADLSFTGANAPPAFPTIPSFQAPSVADALNDPGYKFRLDQGNQQLQNWAAAKGTLNDSSTAKALTDYGQGAASQEYGNIWNRAMNAYQTNTQNQYLAPWAASQQNWQAGTANPATLSYTTKAGAGQNQNQLNYVNAWDQFVNNRNYYSDWQNQTWNKLLQGATA